MNQVKQADDRPRPVCTVVVEAGDALSKGGRVWQTLKTEEQDQRAREFLERAYRAGSYDAV